ncbi:MAG: DUF2127 domain-containing protein [Chloroflexi bacterium]|nr:DUF2127 domain-containing protein [Chloroflexota bacterium]
MTGLLVEKGIGTVFFAIASAVLLTLHALGISHPIESLFARELREDPHDLIAGFVLRSVPELTSARLLLLAYVSLAYLALHLVELVGLWQQRLWVEYLVLVETAAFLPYEVFELVRRPTAFRAAIFVVNAAIVGYLASRRISSRGPLAAG